MLSANLIGCGAPTYRTKSGHWSPQLQEAHPAATEAEADEMLAAAAKEESLVCDPYTFPVALNGQEIDPLTAREQIRAKGPTVAYRRPDPAADATTKR